MLTPRHRVIAIAAIGSIAPSGTCLAQPIAANFPAPDLDRWVYSFNFTPGIRASVSSFSALGEPDFDNRDGQVLLGWDTAPTVQSGLGESAYIITGATVRIGIDQGGLFQYDPTYDEYVTYLDIADPDYVADSDSGRPVEIYGVAYRNGFNDATVLENSPFGDNSLTNRNVRNAYASDYFDGVAQNISNNVDDAFDVFPFAIGAAPLTPGTLVPADTDITFDIDLGNPDAVAYLQRSLNNGRLRLMISSLQAAIQQGGEFASFYSKENFFGDGLAARLELNVTINACPADFNSDNVVDGGDLAVLLAAWGAAPSSPADLNGDGLVDGADLAQLLAAWGPCA